MSIPRTLTGHEVTRTDASTVSDNDALRGMCLHLVCPIPAHNSSVVPLVSGLTIGRSSDCGAKVEAGAVSRQHARFDAKYGLLYCVDLGSRNGTYVNGQFIVETPVGPGDIIRCGDAVWVIGRQSSGGASMGIRFLAPELYGGDSMAEALEPLRRLASSELSVVLEGETGTGKELAARALHAWSGRAGKYVAVNCAALPESMAEGELFGYRKGAFTGAERAHTGIFRAAQHGTLLLDEICELPLRFQAKLLRVLEQREVTPLGESEPVALDVRVVAAAQRPLRDEVSAGRFREDLLTRLGVTVRIPPLRERLEDATALLLRFLERAMPRVPVLQARFVESLLQYRFSKNVRELRQLADWVAMMHRDEPLLRRSHLPSWLLGSGSAPGEGQLPRCEEFAGQTSRDRAVGPRLVPEPYRTQSDQDLPRLLASLELHRGNVVKAAEAIGLSRHQAYRLLRGCPDVSLNEFRRNPRIAANRSEPPP